MEVKKNSSLIPILSLSLAVLVGLFWVAHQFRDLDRDLVTYSKHEKAPDFSSAVQKIVLPQELVGKKRVERDDLKGHVVLLHFFASWCKPCREEKPFLQELVDTYADGSLKIVGFITYESPEAFLKSGLLPETPFTVLTDEEGLIAQSYKLRAIPQSILIDPQGHIRYRIKGPLNRAELNGLKTAISELQKEQLALRDVRSNSENPM